MFFSPTLLYRLWNHTPAEIAGWLLVGAAGAYLTSCYIKTDQSSCLESATIVIELKDLAELLENGTAPHIVRVSGKVSTDEPIVCRLTPSDSPFVPTLVQLQPDSISCVVYEGKTEIIYEDRDNNGDQFSSLMEVKSIHEEVPWYLEDETGRVYVEGIQKARGFDFIAYKREVAGPGTALVRELTFVRELDNRHGMKMLGVKHSECALKVDSVLEVVGKAVKDDSGKITIQEPRFVCQSGKYLDSKSIVFGQLSPWEIVSMFAFVTSLVIFTTEGLRHSP